MSLHTTSLLHGTGDEYAHRPMARFECKAVGETVQKQYFGGSSPVPPKERSESVSSVCGAIVDFSVSHRKTQNPLFTWEKESGHPARFSHLKPLMVEVGGVEPPSEAASAKLLRVYPAFDLARGMPTDGLIPKQPLGCTWARRANGALQAKSC